MLRPEVPSREGQNNKYMRKIQLAILGAAVVMAVQARATLTVYDINFTQTGESDTYGQAVPPSVTDASGWLDVENGLAVGGVLEVTGNGPDAGVYTLVAGVGTDGSFQYDNIVYTTPVNGGFLDSTAGLLWTLNGSAGDNSTASEMNMWYNAGAQYGDPAGSYSLWGALPNYDPEAYGDASLTPAPVPEASTMLAGALLLLPLGIGAIRSLRKERTV
jgi:hypothetical protein